MTTGTLAIRDLRPGDTNFVRNSWLNQHRVAPPNAAVEVDDRGEPACSVTSVLRGNRIHREAQGVSLGFRALSMGVTDTVYFYEQGCVIDALLRSCRVDVLCFADDPDLIVGWMCSDVQDGTPVLHYLYVKERHRGLGHAYRLLAHRGITRHRPILFTHHPPRTFDDRGRGVLSRDGGRLYEWKEGWLRDSAWLFDPYITTFSVARAMLGDIGKAPPQDAPGDAE